MGFGAHAAGRKLIELAMQPSATTLMGHREGPLSPGMETLYICVCILLVVLAGLMAGLTLGLMSLDRYQASFPVVKSAAWRAPVSAPRQGTSQSCAAARNCLLTNAAEWMWR